MQKGATHCALGRQPAALLGGYQIIPSQELNSLLRTGEELKWMLIMQGCQHSLGISFNSSALHADIIFLSQIRGSQNIKHTLSVQKPFQKDI